MHFYPTVVDKQVPISLLKPRQARRLSVQLLLEHWPEFRRGNTRRTRALFSVFIEAIDRLDGHDDRDRFLEASHTEEEQPPYQIPNAGTRLLIVLR